MAYEHKNIYISLITTIIVFIFYSFYMYGKYLEGQFNGPDASSMVGISVFILIGASIVMTIIVHILFAIFVAIITQKEPEKETIRDERDKLIDLKGLQIFVLIFSFGFVGSMGALAFGVASYLVFVSMIFSMFLANVFSDIAKLFYYHFGVKNG